MEICLSPTYVFIGVKIQHGDSSVSLTPSSFPIFHTPVLCLERGLVAPAVVGNVKLRKKLQIILYLFHFILSCLCDNQKEKKIRRDSKPHLIILSSGLTSVAHLMALESLKITTLHRAVLRHAPNLLFPE